MGKVKFEKKTIAELIKDINTNQLLLPNFQREYNWEIDKQKALIASILYDIPIGSILILENKELKMTSKYIGYKKKVILPQNNNQISYLMDGQQRLTTFKGIFDDFFTDTLDNRIISSELYPKLRYRWFLDLNIISKDKKLKKEKLKIILDCIKREDIRDDNDLSDVEDLIVAKPIYKKKVQLPYHPDKTKDGAYFKRELIKDKYIPLFLLLSIADKDIDDADEAQTKIREKNEELLQESLEGIFIDHWFRPMNDSALLDQQDIFCDTLGIEKDILADSKKIKTKSSDFASKLCNGYLKHILKEEKIFSITYKLSFSKAVQAFNSMNTGGLPLGTFDIISAKYAALKKREFLSKRIKVEFKKQCETSRKLLPSIKQNEDNKIFNFKKLKDSEKEKFYYLYLNMLSIFSSKARELDDIKLDDIKLDDIKEKEKLKLKKEEIDKHTDKAVTSIVLAFRFLIGYCGVQKIKDISYQLMVLPIAYNLHYIIFTQKRESTEKDIYKILYWYWNSIFGGRYREKQNSRSIEDIKFLNKLIQKGEREGITDEEDNILNDTDYSDYETLKNNQTPALKKPILQFIFTNDILQSSEEKLDKYSKTVTKKLNESEWEEAHLISKSDYKQQTENQELDGKHYINSVCNLALMLKERNKGDSSKSYYAWSDEKIYKEILIPDLIKINDKLELPQDEFHNKIKSARDEKFDKLCEAFIKTRFHKIQEVVKERLKFFRSKFEKN